MTVPRFLPLNLDLRTAQELLPIGARCQVPDQFGMRRSATVIEVNRTGPGMFAWINVDARTEDGTELSVPVTAVSDVVDGGR